MKKPKSQRANPLVTAKLKAAKKTITIKAVNTKPADWVYKADVMREFRFSLRTMDYYHANRILPFSKLDKRTFYYMPGILRILEQNLQY